MTDPSQYFKGRTVQEQMNEVIGYVDVRSAEVATDAIAADVAQVHSDAADAHTDALAAAASAAAAAGTLANAVKKTGEASQSIAGDIAVAGDLSGGTVTVPTPVNNTDAASKKYVDDQDALDAKLAGATFTGQLNASGQRAYNPTNTDDVATIGTLDAYTPMVRTTGNQTISGTKKINGLAVESNIDPNSMGYQEGVRFSVYNTDDSLLSNHIYSKSGEMIADQWLVYKFVDNATIADRLRLNIRINDTGGEVYANYRWYDADGTMHQKEHVIYSFDRN